MAAPVAFFERPYPSANAVLLLGPRPVLVDPGFGADVPALLAWLAASGVPPESLAMVFNTHFDCDHAGANHALAACFGLPVGTGAGEAALVNARDPEAGRAAWLHQPLEPYRVAQALAEGDVIDTGAWRWCVLATPGHTPGHVSLQCAEAATLVVGDCVHADDLGWVDFRRPAGLDEAAATLERLAGLRVARAYSGHGPMMDDLGAAVRSAQRRLAAWRREPERMGWHAVKRIFAYALMVEDGLAEADIRPYLAACPWFASYAAGLFRQPAPAFADALLAEMLRSGAARWVGGRLVAGTPFVPPRPGWASGPVEVSAWPR